MRFAGARMEGYLNDEGPKFDEMGITDLQNRNNESVAATSLMGKTAATGIKAAGDVEAAGIVGAARAGLANAQGNAAIMKGIGSIASSAIGAIPTGGGGGSVGTGSAFGEVGTSGSDMSAFGYTPAQERAFHNGGIDYGYL